VIGEFSCKTRRGLSIRNVKLLKKGGLLLCLIVRITLSLFTDIVTIMGSLPQHGFDEQAHDSYAKYLKDTVLVRFKPEAQTDVSCCLMSLHQRRIEFHTRIMCLGKTLQYFRELNEQ
jgi:hypothetical protein